MSDESHSDAGRRARTMQFCWSVRREHVGAGFRGKGLRKTVEISRDPSAQFPKRGSVGQLLLCAALLVSVFLHLPPTLLAQEGAQADVRSDRRITIVTDDAPLNKLPERSKRWALLVGIDEYQDLNISRLYGAANDVRAMRTVLTERAGFPNDQVVMLATGEPAGMLPTRSNILSKLSNLLAMTPKDGLFLLEFSGHGIERRNRPFLLPTDAALSDDPDLLEQLAISVEWLKRAIEGRGIAQVVVLLDACRNEPGGRANADNPLTQNLVDGFSFKRRNEGVQAFATLFATERGERAWEDTVRKRGYFSLALEEALIGEAANQAGEVTLSSLLQYLQDRVPLRVARDLGADKQQRPYAQIEGYRANDLVLAVVPKTSPISREQSLCEEAWGYAKDSTRRASVEEFIRQFPDCIYTPIAEVKLRSMPTGITSERQPDVRQMGSTESPSVNPIDNRGLPVIKSFAAEPYLVERGQSSTLRWVVEGAEEIAINNGIGSVAPEGTRQVFPPNATTYTLTAKNRNGTSARSVTVDVTVPDRRSMPTSIAGRIPVTVESTPPLDIGNGVTMEFVYIPAGAFLMGCSEGDTACEQDEEPRRRVRISKDFEIGRYEVTQDQWNSIMHSNPSRFKGKKKPVTMVSWSDVQKFLERLNLRNDGYVYRLPSEAEWEYAARAGEASARYGDLNSIAWTIVDAHEGSHEVGGKRANAWGLHDVLGNVREWCSDWYEPTYYKDGAIEDPIGPLSGRAKVVRGGSWQLGDSFLRLSYRSRSGPTVRDNFVGFRCVRERR